MIKKKKHFDKLNNLNNHMIEHFKKINAECCLVVSTYFVWHFISVGPFNSCTNLPNIYVSLPRGFKEEGKLLELKGKFYGLCQPPRKSNIFGICG